MHLLKWKYQPERRGPSWKATIKLQRSKITELLVEMPSLRKQLQAGLSQAYQHAVLMAASKTDLPENHFPASCPFALKQVLDAESFPE